MKRTIFYAPLLILISLLFTACQQEGDENSAKARFIQEGMWQGNLLNGSEKEVPFLFRIEGSDTENPRMLVITPKIGAPADTIVVDEWVRNPDEETYYIFKLPVFDAEIRANLQNDGSLVGSYFSFSNGSERVLAFRATPQTDYLFSEAPQTSGSVAGRWETEIVHQGDTSTAIGVFEQEGAQVTGTFLTKTGDYRFLAGQLDGQRLQLSAFDGEHIFLFEADYDAENEKLTNGHFYSGKGYHATWEAQRNDTISLPDPEKLTYLKEGVTTLDFSFPDLNGDTVSLSDERFKNKVVLVQILGSWCPNCMDETKFLAPFYRQQQEAGADFEIIGLAFERTDNDMEKAVSRVKRMKERLGADYPILIAGLSADKETSGQALPQLNAILSFPTTLYLSKSGQVRKIHTGFSGPATGKPFEDWKADFERTVADLLAE